MKTGSYKIYYKTYYKCEVHQNTNSIKETKHHTQLSGGSGAVSHIGVSLTPQAEVPGALASPGTAGKDDFTFANIKHIVRVRDDSYNQQFTYLEEEKLFT